MKVRLMEVNPAFRKTAQAVNLMAFVIRFAHKISCHQAIIDGLQGKKTTFQMSEDLFRHLTIQFTQSGFPAWDWRKNIAPFRRA